MMKIPSLLMKIYGLLRGHFGYLNWWPAETPFEVAVGTILTQNVAWSNVEKSIEKLRQKGLLNLRRLIEARPEAVKECISHSGYYNVKYKRLMALMHFIRDELEGKIENIRRYNLNDARRRLLDVKGVGKETADSILLYAANFPVFVVDAYTKRSFYRIGILKSEDMDYDEIQSVFMNNLRRDVRLYNDYHAQIVELSKNFCRKSPLCKGCPLGKVCRRVIS
ncbi:MAG: endonuclease [Deltaproteobacteria bacterium]|nr:endonuclease [Deltaproteobacteria bacterium]